MTAGFQILPLPPSLTAEQLALFARFSASHLADSMASVEVADSGMAPRHRPGTRLYGCALTVRTAPGDNLLVQKALELARPGDVIVVDGGGDARQALVGEIMGTLAQKRGIAGFVVDGAVRDLDFISACDLPIYSTAISPRGPSREGPGEINGPVTLAGMKVSPGDIIVGDADGVVAVPRAEAEKILAAAHVLRQKEEATLKTIRDGDIDRSWIDVALRKGGCKF